MTHDTDHPVVGLDARPASWRHGWTPGSLGVLSVFAFILAVGFAEESAHVEPTLATTLGQLAHAVFLAAAALLAVCAAVVAVRDRVRG